MSLHWEMKTLKTIYIIVAAWMVAACQQKAPTQASKEEDNESKRLLQGVWIDDEYALARDCYKALDDISFPFIIEVRKSHLVVPKTMDELFKYILSGCYSKLYFLSGFREVVNCSADISELEGAFNLEIKNEETKESVLSLSISLPGSVISQIRKCMSENRE